MSHPETQSGQNPTDLSAPLSLTQPSSSRTTGDRKPIQHSDLTTAAHTSSHTSKQDSLRAPSGQSSGFFAGASNIDASHEVFNDIAGDLINIELKENDLFLLNKLPHAKNAGYRSEYHEQCLPGTRKEELQRIEQWEVDASDKRVYWLNGLSGAGKSTIAKTIAERSSAKGRLGASFFCSRDFPDRRNIHLIFPTLAFDLARRYPPFRKALIQVLSSNPDAADESLAIQLEDLLVRPLKSTKLSTTIVIDALDECEDNEPASAILSLLARHIDEIPSVKFFITGRPEPQIRSGFRLPLLRPHREAFVLHSVDPSSVDQAIELYLRTRLSEIAAERSHWDWTVPWPANDEIISLVKRCSGLFIVASILTRLIGDPHLDPKEQLKKLITSEADFTILTRRSGIDEVYYQVFLQSFLDVDISHTEFFDLLRLVVGSITLVFTPLSCADLAKILDIPRETVRNVIRSLHSVLIVPDSDTEALRICHKSFADFLTVPSRCIDKRFYIDDSVLHLNLGMHCLKLMSSSLKKNICDLPPYAMNDDIDDLDARREKYIGGGLEYACKSWARHLLCGSRDGIDVGHIVELLEYFFKHHLLSWLGVLSIVGDMSCAVYLLRDARRWLSDVVSSDTDLLDIMKDCERFILRFFDAIEASACHIYHTALPCSPGASLVRALYQDQISTEVKMVNSIDDVWDACTSTIQTRNYVWFVAFSHGDDFIAVGEEGCVELFQTLTGKRRAIFMTTEAASYESLAFSPDDSLLVTGRDDGVIDLWDLQTGEVICRLEGHTRGVHSVAFSPCGTMIASGSNDCTVGRWYFLLQLQGGSIFNGHSNPVQTVCWSTRGNIIVSCSNDRTVRVWDITEMTCVKVFPGHVDVVWSFACSPDSLFIALGSKYEVKILNAQTGHVFQSISTDGLVDSIRFLDQDMIMYATDSSTFMIQDFTEKANTPSRAPKNWLSRYLRKAQIRFELPQSKRRSSKTDATAALLFKYQGNRSAISSDGTHIASQTRDDVKIWKTDGPSPNPDIASHSNSVHVVTFSKDGRLIASGSWDATVKLWEATTGRCFHTFSHSGWVTSVIISPDSTRLASGTGDRRIHIWDTDTHNLISTFNTRGSPKSLGFSPNGNRLVSVGYSPYLLGGHSMDLELLEVATGKCLAYMEVDEPFEKVTFIEDGTSVIMESKHSVMRCRISPNQSYVHEDNKHSLLPMEFVPLRDTKQPASPRLYHYPQESEWILDEQGRQVLWIHPDLRGISSDCYRKRVVIGSRSGRILILDLSNVHY